MVAARERMILLAKPIVTSVLKIGTLGSRQQKGILSKFMQPVGVQVGPELSPFDDAIISQHLCRLLWNAPPWTLVRASPPMPAFPDRQREESTPHIREMHLFSSYPHCRHKSHVLGKALLWGESFHLWF